MIGSVDPFIGTGATDLAPPEGLAATWWWPKPQVGNTHPGACHPLGMVSACAYSGAYPTGYGVYRMSTEGVPLRLYDRPQASGFTHFQQSGPGAIRKYYNYFRVTPMLEPLDALGDQWQLTDEVAAPGYYAATLGSGIRCEITVGPKSAVHRYTFPESSSSRVVVDFSQGGLAIEHGRTVPVRGWLESSGTNVVTGQMSMEGVPISVHAEFDTPEWRPMLWYDRRLMAGGNRLDFDSIRETTLRPFGFIVLGPTSSGDTVEVRLGFSLRGVEQARDNLRRDCGDSSPAFEARRSATAAAWTDYLGRVRVEGGSSDRRTAFATAMYHSLIKPSFATDESPFWPTGGPWVFDIATMWDIYKTQLPLLTTIAADRSVELINALVKVCEEEGNFPIGYRMARGSDRFFRQASALAHTLIADAAALGLRGVDWDWALVHMHADLRRMYGEEYLERGITHPVSHTLDLAMGYHCSARVARLVGDNALAGRFDALASNWRNAFDPETGLLVDSTFYEGGRWNYSFRLVHDMASRIELAGGARQFVELLDRFFGFDAEPVKQLGEAPDMAEVNAGYMLDRFEGLNNEPDMETPWAYHYAGRPDRTAEVVHAVLTNQFGTGTGGLPGNDDSGGLSSWYVWASLGLFPVAGQSTFLISTPSFAHGSIEVGGGNQFVIETEGFTEPEQGGPVSYVQAAYLDDRPLERSYLDGRALRRGGRLRLTLGPEPTGWGSAELPPSRPSTDTERREK